MLNGDSSSCELSVDYWIIMNIYVMILIPAPAQPMVRTALIIVNVQLRVLLLHKRIINIGLGCVCQVSTKRLHAFGKDKLATFSKRTLRVRKRTVDTEVCSIALTFFACIIPP